MKKWQTIAAVTAAAAALILAAVVSGSGVQTVGQAETVKVP